MNKKLRTLSVNSIIIRMDNENDPDRTHVVEADVTINNSGVESFYNGSVSPLPGSESTGSAIFHEYNNGESSISCKGVDRVERAAMLEAVEIFCDQARTEAQEILSKIQPQV